MQGGLRYETGRDMPPGMLEKVAVKLAANMVADSDRKKADPNDCIKKVKRKTNFAKIIVSGTAEKPYYEIMWFDYIDGQYHIGYGSYNLDFVFRWLSECFEIEDAPAVDPVHAAGGCYCLECKHWEEVDTVYGKDMVCTNQGCMKVAKLPDDFCSRGERRAGE